MARSRRTATAVALLICLAGLVGLTAPATGDMHGACDRVGGQDLEQLPVGPVGYANVYLLNETGGSALTFGGELYCPGAQFQEIELTLRPAGGDEPIAHVVLPSCTATVAEPCSIAGHAQLDPGTYWVVLEFDANDPQQDSAQEPEYDDTIRRQRFTWTGQGQPVLTCPDAGYIHANPPADCGPSI